MFKCHSSEFNLLRKMSARTDSTLEYLKKKRLTDSGRFRA